MFVNATDVKNNFGFYLTVLDKEDVIILRNGKPVARLTPQTNWKESQRLGEGTADYDISDENEDLPDEYDGCSMTYSQFAKMYDKTDKRYEYIDGKVWPMGAPAEEHQRVIGNLYYVLRNQLTGKTCRTYLAPLDVYLGSRTTDRNIVQPDLLVVCSMEKFNERGRYIGAPDVTIEVLSPFNRRHDLIRKMDLYLRSGVDEYWTIDTANRLINIYRFKNGQIVCQNAFAEDAVVRSDFLQGLMFPARTVFE
jgi:prevent-host-death family protein